MGFKIGRFLQKHVEKPIRKGRDKAVRLLGEASGEVAGASTVALSPWVLPLEMIVGSLTPTIGVDLGSPSVDVDANLQVSFPQISMAGAAPTGSTVPADAGGLLRDLALDTRQLRNSLGRLEVLEAAMKKGLYPSKADRFSLRVVATPVDGLTSIHFVIRLRWETDNTQQQTMLVQVNARDLDDVRKATLVKLAHLEDAQYNRASSRLPSRFSFSDEASVEAPRGKLSKLAVQIDFLDVNGTPNPELGKHLERIRVVVTRRNRSFTEDYAFFEAELGTTSGLLAPTFMLDRREYISSASSDFAFEEFLPPGTEAAGGGMNKAAKLLRDAINLIHKLPTSLPAVEAVGADHFWEFVLDRVVAAQRIRELLWSAGREIKALTFREGVLDFRPRYHVRIRNLGNLRRQVDLVRVRSRGDGLEVESSVEKLELPAYSTYEFPVFPLMKTKNMINEIEVRLTPESAPLDYPVTVELEASLGSFTEVVRSYCPSPSPKPQREWDGVLFDFKVADAAD